METHAGYMGGLKREFCSNTTLPYYATSSEEVLFHVSTRMPSKGSDVEQKVMYTQYSYIQFMMHTTYNAYSCTRSVGYNNILVYLDIQYRVSVVDSRLGREV